MATFGTGRLIRTAEPTAVILAALAVLGHLRDGDARLSGNLRIVTLPTYSP